jgi:putative methionine-R-sulfoxide reductase with GAF domain
LSKPSTTPTRDYAALSSLRPLSTREATMQACVDAIWDLLSPAGVSWVGFYTLDEGGSTMTLGPRRDKPACSPIELHGMCGKSCLEKRAIIVRDVRSLGESYIACDPKDMSELVIPLLDANGACYGVLDLDSYETNSFGERDADELTTLVERLGLSRSQPAAAPRTL